MTGYPHDGRVRRPVDHSWVLTAWVLPLVVAVAVTVVTAGFGALTIPVAVIVGLVATALHLGYR